MAVITKTQRTHLRKMNKAAKDASFDTNIVDTGSLVVTIAQMSASRVTILDPGATHGFMFQYTRSGSPVPTLFSGSPVGISASLVAASGSLNIQAFGPSGSMLNGDVIDYIMW